MDIRDQDIFRPVKVEEGEGFSPNAVLLEAQRRAIQAILTGEFPPPQPGERHDVFLAVYQPLKALLNQLGVDTQGLDSLIQATTTQSSMEEERSSTEKRGTSLSRNVPSPQPTRASEASRTQQRVQAI